MRSFIAIALPESVINLLKKLQQDFGQCGADVRWVKPGGIHLTLKFLGDIDEKKADDITKSLQTITERYDAFNLVLSGIGIFPHNRTPRVLWVGIERHDALSRLQKDIDDGLALLGFEKENRRFSPHLTLGRFRSARGKEALMNKSDTYRDFSFGKMDVKSVLFMRSDLGQSGATYTKLAELFLKGNNI